jgi:hydrogenase maturation protein HypF
VTGVVQGVGFRPFVHRLAGEHGLTGHVGNDDAGVFVEVEGPARVLDHFEHRLTVDHPPLALVDSVTSTTVARGAPLIGFTIVESEHVGGRRTSIPPDVAVCDACLAEVLDPRDRRHRYPFANCTDCGPRFTIIRDLPYDRPATTMAGFPMCDACRAEYGDPADRRYHAQPIACPDCGPHVALERDGAVTTGTDAVIEAVQGLLIDGRVVAVKGIGGYHLACDATDDRAVGLLRRRKQRGDRPFAVMVPDLAAVEHVAEVADVEAAALLDPARPIVLLRALTGTPVSRLVAPHTPTIGVMLPYSPLHHLLFRPVPGSQVPPPTAIVLTSGNLADEPICFDDADARHRLAGLADALCTHDRPIAAPCDDSVVRVVDGRVQPIRRSRGVAPLPVVLPVEVAPSVGVGAELKNTSCVATGRRAWMSQHVGDMEHLETLHAFERSVESLCRMYRVDPTVWGVDRHPGYRTTRWAQQHHGDRIVPVQHHHAHVAALMAEHGLDGTSPVIGVAFDGTGEGTDAAGATQIWGGEVLLADYDGFERVGWLRPLPLPGGDGAVRNPCRIAVADLVSLGIVLDPRLHAVAACEPTELAVVTRQVERGIGCVPTTSMGRLFDAVSSLLGVRHRVTYEAQAAMELEWLAERGSSTVVPLAFTVGDDGVIDPEPLLRALVAHVLAGTPAADLALAFHRAVADAVVRSAVRVRADVGVDVVGLTGGVFQNALLARLTREGLEAVGFTVLVHRLVPPNDGGLALGQAVVAGVAARRRPPDRGGG